jgi:hypothetical protein
MEHVLPYQLRSARGSSVVSTDGAALGLVLVSMLVEGWDWTVLSLFIEPAEPLVPLVPWFWVSGPCADESPGVLVTWGAEGVVDVCATAKPAPATSAAAVMAAVRD